HWIASATLHWDIYARQQSAPDPASMKRSIRHKFWGGPPGPRGSPGTLSLSMIEQADAGVGRGPGGPPHNLFRCWVVGTVCGIFLLASVAWGADFSGKSALEYTRKAVAFGSRPPASPANLKLQAYIQSQLKL